MLWWKVPQDVSVLWTTRLHGCENLFRKRLLKKTKQKHKLSYPSLRCCQGSDQCDFKRARVYSRATKWSSLLKVGRMIPNPEATAWMNIYVTAPVFHKINHPSQPARRLSRLDPPFLLFVVSYVPPYALGIENTRKLSSVSDSLSSLAGWRERRNQGGQKDWEKWSENYGMCGQEMSPLLRCGREIGEQIVCLFCVVKYSFFFYVCPVPLWDFFVTSGGFSWWWVRQCAQEKPDHHSITHSDGTLKGKMSTKLTQDFNMRARRMMERRQRRAQMRWTHHNNLLKLSEMTH